MSTTQQKYFTNGTRNFITEASNTRSVAGDFSFVSGLNNHAGGLYSFAVGANNDVTQTCSAALGLGLRAWSENQIVFGKYNDAASNENYAVIVGAGSGPKDSERRNVFTLDWDGNAWFAGGIKTLNSNPVDPGDMVNLEYFKENVGVKFFPHQPYTDSYGNIKEGVIKIVLNDLDEYSSYKVKMDEPFNRVLFVARAHNGVEREILSHDSTINKYNMFVGKKYDDEIYFDINAKTYHIFLAEKPNNIRVEIDYDLSFSVGGDGSTGASIDDNNVSLITTYSSQKITDLLAEKYDNVKYENGELEFYANDVCKKIIEMPLSSFSYENDFDPEVQNAEDALGSIFNKLGEFSATLGELTYKNPSVSRFICTPIAGDREIGDVVNNVTFNWEISAPSKPITSQTFNGQSLATTDRTYSYVGAMSSGSYKFTLTISDGKGSGSAALTFTFKHRIFWGAANEPSTYDGDFISGLSGNRLDTGIGGSISATAAAGEYIYYCFPTKWGTPIFNIGGFDGGFKRVDAINYTNPYGVEERYDIWRTNQAGLGAITANLRR